MEEPLIITRDEALQTELERLAAAAGVHPRLTTEQAGTLQRWARAPVVLVGADVVEEVNRWGPGRRTGVHVVAWGGVPDELFRDALALGAEDVAELPRSGSWVLELLSDLGDAGRQPGRVIGVLGGCGGGGATTLTAALGLAAVHRKRTAMLVDTDPCGPGLDRVLGMETVDGVRWDAVTQTTGRLSAASLREALPRLQGLGVLTWGSGTPGSVQPFAVKEVVNAGRRGHDLVLLDLPRGAERTLPELVSRCDELVVVTTATVPSIAATARLLALTAGHAGRHLVVRGTGVPVADIRRLTGFSEVHAMRPQRGLDEAVDLGLGPLRSHRGPLGRLALELVDRLAARPAGKAR